VRSCILFQLDFSLQAEKSRFRDTPGGEAIFGANRTRTARASAAERDADVENEPVGIPAGESMVITEIWQDRHLNVQNSHTLRMGRDAAKADNSEVGGDKRVYEDLMLLSLLQTLDQRSCGPLNCG
jgi:hypothetical protein